ncbi:hypothetical protein [Flavobacterium adhaerens]|uniref:hypothetical protein n=1 Tax=Flavobacterium adhaerens TaxID=3149043 RepID=UPI0032B617CC
MKKSTFSSLTRTSFILFGLLFYENVIAQYTQMPQSRSPFWEKVQFGGGLGLSFGSGYTDIMVSPSAVYNFNPVVAVGTSLLFGYVNTDTYESIYYGGSLIGLVNPIPQIQLSAELEQTRFNTDYEYLGGHFSDDYWNTALYLGAGFRTRNVTIGIRYDVLYDENKSIYSEPYMPFVRVYF